MSSERALLSIEHALASARQDAFGGRSDQRSTDLLRPTARAALRHAVASWNPVRTSAAQKKWRLLLSQAAARPRSLGFVVLGSGGTGDLGDILGTSAGRASSDALRWEDRGVVRLYHVERDRGLPRLAGLQVPDLTDALVWLATRAYYKLNGIGVDGPPMTINQAQLIAATLLRRREPIPEITTFDQAARLLDELNSAARS